MERDLMEEWVLWLGEAKEVVLGVVEAEVRAMDVDLMAVLGRGISTKSAMEKCCGLKGFELVVGMVKCVEDWASEFELVEVRLV
ncbi:hypothetical protein ACLOJK_028389 [Asimina triloba]